MSQGHVLVVGATSGIGAAVADHLESLGWRASRFGRRASGQNAFQCDVTDDASVSSAFADAAETMGEPRALVYCAGAAAFGRTASIPKSDARACLEANFWGLDRCVREVLPSFERRGSGQVVAVLSVASQVGIAFEAYYAASKAAAQRYLDCLRVELEPAGVRVRYLCPGHVATGFYERASWYGREPSAVQGSGVTVDFIGAAVGQILAGGEVDPVLGWRERLVTAGNRLVPGLYERWQIFRNKGSG